MINEVNKSDKKDTSYHAIGFEPIIDNEAYVHHIVILACDYKNVYYSDQIFRCEESPPDCMQNMIGWGVGQKTFEFPPEAGMMWGTFESYFVVLQIHYNNPTKVINQVDSSGFSIFYTSKLRQYDMGVSFLGQLNIRDVKIPPNTKNTQLSYKCPKKCLNDIPSEGYNIVLTAYHQHRLGRKIRAVITKPDGTVDDTTFREDNYDFEHQKWVINNPPYKVLPGSSFETTCEWDSSGIDSYTLGGPGTDNEMCVVFFYYYPKENGVQYCFEGKTEKDDICIFNKKVDRVELGWAANSTYLNRSLILVITYLALSYIIM